MSHETDGELRYISWYSDWATDWEIFLISRVPRSVLGPTHFPFQWVLGLKWSGHEGDHSLPPIDNIKNAWIYTSNSLNVCVWGIVFI